MAKNLEFSINDLYRIRLFAIELTTKFNTLKDTQYYTKTELLEELQLTQNLISEFMKELQS